MKKGKLTKDDKNQLVINEENKNYSVDKSIATIWIMCDGNNTDEQIIDDLAAKTKVDKVKISEAVSEILSRLEKLGLVVKV